MSIYLTEQQITQWLAEHDDPDFDATMSMKLNFIARKSAEHAARVCAAECMVAEDRQIILALIEGGK